MYQHKTLPSSFGRLLHHLTGAHMQNEEIIKKIDFLQTNKSFLGREFLTWLWYKTETENHKIEIKDIGIFEIYLDDKIILSSSSGSVRENSLKGISPAYAREAASALHSGKMVQEANFIVIQGDKKWSFSLNSQDLSLKNIKTPNTNQKEFTDHVTKRIELSNCINLIVDALYKEFIYIRTGKNFNKQIVSFSEWIHKKLN
jgi:hypothetical protein